MSLNSDTLSWFWANQSLSLLHNTMCLADGQQISILVFGFDKPGHKPGQKPGHKPMLNITSLMWLEFTQ
jgi:hypothetical protein